MSILTIDWIQKIALMMITNIKVAEEHIYEE